MGNKSGNAYQPRPVSIIRTLPQINEHRLFQLKLEDGSSWEDFGHNPRGTQALRLKRRHEHKLLHYNETDIQEALCGCVGCGRCSDYCPVHIGTLEVVKAIAESDT
ncbi:MAG: 4Fe-4S dicluster domain-containing protein [Thermodesulfobacteriota bacterium]|nr:4Fe-4S dicluster domain-containing protein [Thermodesulfobacteriota bacterium]